MENPAAFQNRKKKKQTRPQKKPREKSPFCPKLTTHTVFSTLFGLQYFLIIALHLEKKLTFVEFISRKKPIYIPTELILQFFILSQPKSIKSKGKLVENRVFCPRDSGPMVPHLM